MCEMINKTTKEHSLANLKYIHTPNTTESEFEKNVFTTKSSNFTQIYSNG